MLQRSRSHEEIEVQRLKPDDDEEGEDLEEVKNPGEGNVLESLFLSNMTQEIEDINKQKGLSSAQSSAFSIVKNLFTHPAPPCKQDPTEKTSLGRVYPSLNPKLALRSAGSFGVNSISTSSVKKSQFFQSKDDSVLPRT